MILFTTLLILVCINAKLNYDLHTKIQGYSHAN